MAGTIMCSSILHREHPILHELTIYAEDLWKEGEEGEASEFTQSGSIVTVSEPATLL